MPASLWLVPPPGSALEITLHTLIQETLPRHFLPDESVPSFVPHLTLTSRLPKEFDDNDAQRTLGQIEVAEPPEVVFTKLDIGKTFFTRLTLHAAKNPALVALAQQCRLKFASGTTDAVDAAVWANSAAFTPHLSLVYSEMEPTVLRANILEQVEQDIAAAGVVVGGAGIGDSELGGWKGGRIVLVQTWKPLNEWKVLAEKQL